jgi:superfamily II DNA/RNA helicase
MENGNQKISKHLENLGITALNEMQEAAFQSIQENNNTILLSPTGSGKTLAFLWPILHLLDPEKTEVQCLVLSPTRELAIQIERVWQRMSTNFKVNSCYGGHPMPIETQNLTQPPAILVGTPGRILEHITRKTFDQRKIQILVLDEFDKALSMGFQEQMTDIIKSLRGLKKRVLVSATNKVGIPPFTQMSSPKYLNFLHDDALATNGLTVKRVISPTQEKHETLFRLLCHLGSEPTLIFCNMRETTENTHTFLTEKGLDAAFFHGGLEQIDREKTLIQFRNGSTVFLVTSDLVARGLDIPEVKNVIHLEIPQKHNDFLHRNGRTARMQAEGTAYLVLSKNEHLPAYLSEKPEELTLPNVFELPQTSPWITVYVSGGKKDKLSRIDIVGSFSKVGKLEKDDLGKIEILDFMSFVAVKRTKVARLVKDMQVEKIKGKKYKITVTR